MLSEQESHWFASGGKGPVSPARLFILYQLVTQHLLGFWGTLWISDITDFSYLCIFWMHEVSLCRPIILACTHFWGPPMCQTLSSTLIILRSVLRRVGQGIIRGDCLWLLNTMQHFPSMNQRDMPLSPLPVPRRGTSGRNKGLLSPFPLFHFLGRNSLLGVNLVYSSVAGSGLVRKLNKWKSIS